MVKKFENINWEIRRRHSKKDRQYNDQGKGTKIRTMVDNYYTEN